jgi:hypothetical protein
LYLPFKLAFTLTLCLAVESSNSIWPLIDILSCILSDTPSSSLAAYPSIWHSL